MQFPISTAIHNIFEHVGLDSRILFNFVLLYNDKAGSEKL